MLAKKINVQSQRKTLNPHWENIYQTTVYTCKETMCNVKLILVEKVHSFYNDLKVHQGIHTTKAFS